jgi:peptidoglycan/xylan/chitin deacetylase (PgdA/CDA1 family)
VKSVCGVTPTIVRTPGGAVNQRVKNTVKYPIVSWSVDTLDWKIKNAEQLHDKIISSARNGTIILCHDIHKTTVDAMETVIPTLISEGYQLVTFTEMMAFSHERLQGGNVYRMK